MIFVCRKTQHQSKRAALKHIKNLERRNRMAGGSVYKCPDCGAFHITKQKATR